MRRRAGGLLAPQNRAVSLTVMASMALAFYNATSVTAADAAPAATLSSAYVWSLGALAATSALTVPAALAMFQGYNSDRNTRD